MKVSRMHPGSPVSLRSSFLLSSNYLVEKCFGQDNQYLHTKCSCIEEGRESGASTDGDGISSLSRKGG